MIPSSVEIYQHLHSCTECREKRVQDAKGMAMRLKFLKKSSDVARREIVEKFDDLEDGEIAAILGQVFP